MASAPGGHYEIPSYCSPVTAEGDYRIERIKDMNDMVNVAEEISESGAGRDGRQKAANMGEGQGRYR